MAAVAPSNSRNTYQIPEVQLAADEELRVVTCPSGIPDETRQAGIASLISTLSVRPPTHLHAVETVTNILVLAFPQLALRLARVRTLRIVNVALSAVDFQLWLSLDDKDEGATGAIGFPLLSPPKDEAQGVTSVVAVYAGVASLLYSMGKQASESSSAAALDKRPDALIRRFNIGEADQGLFPGRPAGPAREALELVYNAFSTYTEVRSSIISFFIGVRRGSTHYPLRMEVVMTNFQLMRGAGMTHVDAVLKLAKMHPWTLRVPELTPYWEKFASELTAFQRIEEDIRPYHRLMVGQTDYLFISAEYRPLIAVAGSFMEEVEKTFSGYIYNAGSYTELIEKVRARAPNYVNTASMTSLAALLQLPDVPLPPATASVVSPSNPIV